MFDYQGLKEKSITLEELQESVSHAELVSETNEFFDHIADLIRAAEDFDVTFQPIDPAANDTFASDSDEVHMAWRLGHVIVHATASLEEAASIAQELARGVEWHGRSRYETPWREVTTIAQCRQRLDESRRICLASLQMWPDEPHLDNYYQAAPDRPRINAVGRYIYGLRHTYDHLGQIADIVEQAQAAKVPA